MSKPTLLQSLGNEEMLLSAAIGKVADRLPKGNSGHQYYDAKQPLQEAAAIMEKAIESKAVHVRKKRSFHEGQWKTQTFVTVIGGIAKQDKDIFRGWHEHPPKYQQKQTDIYRLRRRDKEVLSMLSSVLFSRTEHVFDEEIEMAHSVIPKSPSEKEHKARRRYVEYREGIRQTFDGYLSYQYDNRGRITPEFSRLEGIRPHGKSYETYQLESLPRALASKARRILERLRQEYKESSMEDYKQVPQTEDSYKVVHKMIASSIRSRQIDHALSQGSTGMLIEADLTNSGIIIAGLSFREGKMMDAGNVFGNPIKQDSHTNFGKAYGLDRDAAKKLHTPLLHGASPDTLAKKLGVDVGVVINNNYEAYGEAVDNIHTIALYGKAIMDNYRSQVTWKMPDGFVAMHKALTTSVPVTLRFQNRNLTLYKDMPLLLDKQGYPVYDGKAEGAAKHTQSKVMGLYANIIHSIDAYVLREVIRSGIELLPKHDAFLIHPNDLPKLKETLKSIFKELYEMDLIGNILKQIEATTGKPAPTLVYGADSCYVDESEHFLTVE